MEEIATDQRHFQIYVKKDYILCVCVCSEHYNKVEKRKMRYSPYMLHCYKRGKVSVLCLKRKKKVKNLFLPSVSTTGHNFSPLHNRGFQKMAYWGLCFISFCLKAKVKRHYCLWWLPTQSRKNTSFSTSLHKTTSARFFYKSSFISVCSDV